ncbi:PAS domain S-box protein [bacterium]|nr:PAS domain S-box protein [bacterium]QQR57130.1 MAG: PAS domain S-box protein [Candidatus Melainabacteria bacterium]
MDAAAKAKHVLQEDTGQLNALDTRVVIKAQKIYKEQLEKIFCQADVLFGGLLITEWFAGILLSMLWTPRVWNGAISNVHLHVYLAVWLGLATLSLPMFFIIKLPGRPITRHVVAIAQMIMTAFLIHLTGGRIETHFLVFATLAFLTFYRDWKVLVTATIVVFIDHIFRGIYFPFSIYGESTPQTWRFLEHGFWVTFGDLFFVNWCVTTRKEMWEMAKKHARMENTNEIIELQVTARTAEAKLEKERFHILCSFAPVTIFETNQFGNWTFVGQRWSELTGLSPEAALGNGWQNLIHIEEKSEVLKSWAQCIRKGVNWEIEFRIRDIDGKIKWVRGEAVQCRPDVESEPIFIGSIMDITDRKMSENTDRRMVLIAQKEDFLATLSHDLKNPIIGANRILELILNGKMGPVSRELTTIMQKLKDSNTSLLKMIQNLIAIYRYDTGADYLNFELVDLVQHSRAVMSDLSLLAADKGVDLHFEVDNSLDENYSVVADKNSLVRLFSNLLDNALKFTPTNGKITVAVNGSDHTINVDVINTGSYVPEESQKRLFNRFYQGEEGKSYVPGTGLGLYICSQIVQAHHANITCVSTPDNGGETRFRVSFETEKQTSSSSLEQLGVQSSTQHDKVHYSA